MLPKAGITPPGRAPTCGESGDRPRAGRLVVVESSVSEGASAEGGGEDEGEGEGEREGAGAGAGAGEGEGGDAGGGAEGSKGRGGGAVWASALGARPSTTASAGQMTGRFMRNHLLSSMKRGAFELPPHRRVDCDHLIIELLSRVVHEPYAVAFVERRRTVNPLRVLHGDRFARLPVGAKNQLRRNDGEAPPGVARIGHQSIEATGYRE